ncbi:MAG: hypothetical protein JNK90_08370 [Planctomycetaceae bacterium]|nr:hypothetical protein [Planctomycetaceae bacterium]
MGIAQAEAAMRALESATRKYDPGSEAFYRKCVQTFVERRNRLYPGRFVMHDTSEGRLQLPDDLMQRVESWMASHPHFSPYMRRFAVNYLLSLLDEGPGADVYSPLADCVLAGGDFYLEQGFFCFPDFAVSGI